jgi:hypothetical protein
MLRGALKLLSSPRDLGLLLRMSAWRIVLPGLKFLVPLPKLVRLVAAPPRRSTRSPAEERRIVRSALLLYRDQSVLRDNCLERSLLTYRFLTRANASPRLVVGMRKGEAGMLGHAWVTVDGHPVQESAESVAEMTPMMSFGADGRLA